MNIVKDSVNFIFTKLYNATYRSLVPSNLFYDKAHINFDGIAVLRRDSKLSITNKL